VIETLGFLIGQLHHFAGAISESLVHAEASDLLKVGYPTKITSRSLCRLSTTEFVPFNANPEIRLGYESGTNVTSRQEP
jgi:hypothetical protein